MIPMGSGEGAEFPPSIMKFKNTCVSTESKTFYHHKMPNVCKQNDLRPIVTSFVM